MATDRTSTLYNKPHILRDNRYKLRDWQAVPSGVHRNSKGILHATSRALTSAGQRME
jgi:hypothetical protein